MSDQAPITTAFPTPREDVRDALDRLRQGEEPGAASLQSWKEVPRPWEPASCSDPLRHAVWTWCGEVAAWVNHEHVWRPVDLIPPCWPRHPHIARELAVLAVLRWYAELATGPDAVEEWLRVAYPSFCKRMSDRLGESDCRLGRHTDWPARSRYGAFAEADLVADRRDVIDRDAPDRDPPWAAEQAAPSTG